jgi:hypothetical protein
MVLPAESLLSQFKFKTSLKTCSLTYSPCTAHLLWYFFFLWLSDPNPSHGVPLRGFTITPRFTTVGRTPLDELSARRKDLYMTTHNNHIRQTFMPLRGIRTHNPNKRGAADRTATRIRNSMYRSINLVFLIGLFPHIGLIPFSNEHKLNFSIIACFSRLSCYMLEGQHAVCTASVRERWISCCICSLLQWLAKITNFYETT